MNKKHERPSNYLKALIIIWTFCSLIPAIHLFMYISKPKNLWRLEMGLCTIMGPFTALYEAMFFPKTAFPLNPLTDSILGIVLLLLIIIPVKIKNRWLRIIGIVALLIWCLIGCSMSMRFVT